MSNKKFYNLRSADHYAVPESVEGIDPLIFPEEGLALNWKPPHFNVPKNDGMIADYMGSNISGRLCSNKLKRVIEENKLKKEIIQWLPVTIFVEDTGETLQYHHLHFPEPADCLNLKYCKFIDGDLAAPFYSYGKIKERHIFNCPDGYETIITITSEEMLQALEKAECTGLCFEPASVIYDDDETQKAAS